MLNLDDMRREFASFLAESPESRWRMDAALAHVLTLAYNAGVEDGRTVADRNTDLSIAPTNTSGHATKTEAAGAVQHAQDKLYMSLLRTIRAQI